MKVRFEPVGRVSKEALEIPVAVRFPGTVKVPWQQKATASVPAGFVLVDTDGDRVTDTYLPGRSNFIGGRAVDAVGFGDFRDEPGAGSPQYANRAGNLEALIAQMEADEPA